MKLASFITPSFQRPGLLRQSLRCMLRSRLPAGWTLEFVVCLPRDDPGRDAIAELAPKAPWPIRTTHSPDRRSIVGVQRNAALAAARGEVIMLADDDDVQSHDRAYWVTSLWDEGRRMTGTGEVWFFNRITSELVKWVGPPNRLGSCRSFPADMLRGLGGWAEARRNCDHSLDVKMQAAGIPNEIHPLPREVSLSTICTHGLRNVSSIRPWPKPGETAKAGQFVVYPAGSRDFDALPVHAQKALLAMRCL